MVNLSEPARSPPSSDEALAADGFARGPARRPLFGSNVCLGGVLYRYKPHEGDAGVIALHLPPALSLIVHPAIAWGLGVTVGGLTQDQLRAAVVTAANGARRQHLHLRTTCTAPPAKGGRRLVHPGGEPRLTVLTASVVDLGCWG